MHASFCNHRFIYERLNNALKYIPLVVFSALPLIVAAHAVPAQASNDLLVAPTRVVLDDTKRMTEVVLNNIGEKTATYRVSLELKRMTPDGQLVDVAQPNNDQQKALEIISYAPRRVTLAPNQPQAIRIGIRAPADLPDGEYRAHMLFRAAPDTQPVAGDSDKLPDRGFSIQLTPIYGITIPVIIRHGKLEASAALSNPRLETLADGPQFSVDLARSGRASVYGEIRVLRDGQAEPLFRARGLAVYPELEQRRATFSVTPELASKMKGRVTVQYVENGDRGEKLLAETRTELR